MFFVNNSGELYLNRLMSTETAIRRRFLQCLNEVLKTQTQEKIAATLKTHAPYIAKIRVSKATKLSAEFVGTFCKEYGYSPHYILLGEGERMGAAPQSASQEKELIQLRLIEKLMTALLSSGKLDDETKKLARRAMHKS